jgi:ribosome biogenesis GTPase
MPSYDHETLQNGVVYRKSNGIYHVQGDAPEQEGQLAVCELSNRLHKQLVYPEAAPSSINPRVVAVRQIQQVDPVAIGDQVRYIAPNGGNGLIVEVLPRRSRLARREAVGAASRDRHTREQVIVANLDQVMPVFAAAMPSPNWNLLDRYLASAESLGLPSAVLITKMDLAAHDQDLLNAVELYRRLGYPVILTSAANGAGLAELRQCLNGRVTALVGKSGVGKSSVLNALQPGLGLRVSAVSERTGKGRHTTTHLELLPLAGGGAVADTPGTREFGLWQVEEGDPAYLFPEMRALIGQCRFGLDCTHRQEPACALRQAVASGRVDRRRYESMLRMGDE